MKSLDDSPSFEEAKVSFHPLVVLEKNLLSCIDWVYYWIDLDALRFSFTEIYCRPRRLSF